MKSIVFFVLLLFLVERSVAITGYFWQLSDVHYDSQYLIGGNPAYRCIKKTNDTSNPAELYGNYLCDLPLITVESTLQFMVATAPEPDFILFTGDSPPHYLDFTYVEQYTAEMVIADITQVAALITKYFPNTPIYPCLGNHDNYPSDELPPPPKGSAWLSQVGKIWSTWLDQEAHPLDQSELLNGTDIAGQFAWLNETLQMAEENSEKVIIIGHRSIGPDDLVTTPHTISSCTQQYLYVVDRYTDTIVAHIYGHEHQDSFRVFWRYPPSANLQNCFSGKCGANATNVMYIAPSVVTFTGENPSVRLYAYDLSLPEVLVDYRQFVFNLTAANEAVATNRSNAMNATQFWSLEYDALEAYGPYGLNDMSPASWAEVYRNLQQNEELFNMFQRYFTAEANVEPCTGDCLKIRLCAIGNPSYELFTNCFASSS